MKSNWSRKAHVLGIREFSRTQSVIVDSWKNSELGVKGPGFKPRFCYCLNRKSFANCFYVNTGNPCFSLDTAELKPVNPKGNQPWILIGSTEAEAPILWPPDMNSQLIGKDWCWGRLRVGEEGGDRGWDGWIASPIQWTWVWANAGIESFILPCFILN